MSHPLVANFLSFLEVEKREPNLQLLNAIIKSHQLKVKWENLTKMLDYEVGYNTGNYLPPIELYFERVIQKGYGGTCWSISVGLFWFLEKLGFEVHYLYMDSGHLCLRVDLDQPYYVDLGYGAPLFQAYPLYKSFFAQNHREVFQYNVTVDGSEVKFDGRFKAGLKNDLKDNFRENQYQIEIIRTPGPTKTLSPHPVTLEEMIPIIAKSNDWETSPVLSSQQISGYIDGIYTTLKKNILKQYFSGGKVERELTEAEVRNWISKKFHMDLDLYDEAMAIFQKRRIVE